MFAPIHKKTKTTFVPIATLVMGFACLTLISGCVSKVPLSKDVSDETQIAQILQTISDSSKVAVNAQRDLALTVDSKVQREMTMRQRLISDRVTYDFYGDVEMIVGEIASKYGYDFLVFGKRPPEGVPINVFIKDRPVLDVLKNIGVTADYWLSVVVKAGVIEIHYRDVSKRKG